MEERLIECLQIALKYNVTDIHFNIKNNNITIEMRIDGKMYILKPKNNDLAFFRYLMFKANLDVSNLFLAQTGQFSLTINKQKLALRFSVVSSLQITSGVLRILSNHRELIIDDLTDEDEVKDYLNNIFSHHNGLFLFSGPTGSGKTTSLYTILNSCKNKKIFTLEDPIEVYGDNYVQIQINEKQGMTYNEGIKQLLRQDPDIIMIGEIRDSLAAKMAIRTALTGHLVLSSIHSTSSSSTILRLIDLGVERYQLFDVLQGITNQRLCISDDNKKIGIYEVMDRKEIEYYEQNNKHSTNFKSLKEKIEDRKEKGLNFEILK